MAKVQYKGRRRGVLIPLLAVLITALLGIAALTINCSWLMYNRINSQNTADLSSRAALIQLTGDTEYDGRIDRARDLAVRMYELNIDRTNASIDAESIRFGVWERGQGNADNQFTEKFNDSDVIAAVHVDQPTKAVDRNVKVYLSEFVGGTQSVDIVSEAIASTRPLDIFLCLDASRSMNRYSVQPGKQRFPPGSALNLRPVAGSRYFEMLDTVELFLAAMRDVNPNARIGLVTFGGGPNETSRNRNKVVSPLDATLARLEDPLALVVSPAVEGIVETLESYTELPTLGLGTSIYDGVRISVENFDNLESSKHIILLSDGQQAAVETLPSIEGGILAAAEGIRVHTIAFATNANELNAIADETGGSKFFAESEDELREAFAQLLGKFRTQLVD